MDSAVHLMAQSGHGRSQHGGTGSDFSWGATTGFLGFDRVVGYRYSKCLNAHDREVYAFSGLSYHLSPNILRDITNRPIGIDSLGMVILAGVPG